MASLELGTLPNQVPTNGDLGELAFMNRAHVEILGGNSSVDAGTFNAINRQIPVSAVSVFVYDTRKDSDGGAWRKRCQHTSWYNEKLNTSTRGARREFPSVAVIVCTTNTMTIYDGDDPELPMWIVFAPNGMIDWPTSTHTRLAATAVNGGIVVVSEDGGEWFRFIDDTTHIIYSSQSYNVTSDRSIASRNVSPTYTSSGGAVNTYTILTYACNDVAMTVLPNAPIDAATGLPVPTIAVATNSGVSVIKHDGSTVNITCNNGSYTISRKVTFLADNALGLSLEAGSASSEDSFYVFNTIPAVSTVITVDTKSGSPISADAFYSAQMVNTANVNLFLNGLDSNRVINKVERLNFGTPFGLTQIAENRSSPSAGMAAFIASKYNTGWMIGNTKGAWLSSATQETVVGSEKLSSNTFYNTGWTTSGAGDFVINSNGTVTVTGTGNKGESYLTSPTFNTVVGKRYVITLRTTSASGTGIGIYPYGTNGPNGYIWDWDFFFTSTAVSTSFFFYRFGGHTGSATLTSVSVREVDEDRSANFKGLVYYGTITKATVASGSDLVGYSGWSMSGGSGVNYLKGPYPLTIGTSDFSFSFWIKASTDGGQQSIFGASEDQATAIYAGPYISLYTDGTVYMGMYQAGGLNPVQSPYGTGRTVTDGNWHHVCFVKRGTNVKQYIDGIFNVANDSMYASCAAFNYVTFGIGYRPLVGSLALFKLSLTAPSVEQITKMYNDERFLFQDNAKATLYGTSDAVTALAYDKDTNLLHAGTSSGRSVFNGLRRIDNTTSAVSASISASNGLVAEQ